MNFLRLFKKRKPKPPALRRKEHMPSERESVTHCFDIGGHKTYLTVGEFEDGRLGEIYLKIDKEGTTVHGFANCFSIAVSIALQHGISFGHLYDKFSYQDFEPNGMTNQREIYSAKSIVDYVFKWLALRYDENGHKKKQSTVRRAGIWVKIKPR